MFRFGKATLALALALYGWSMIGIELYLRGAMVPEGPDRALAMFRRLIMGRAVVGLGAAAIAAAVVMALLGARRQRVPAATALLLAGAWAVLLWRIWPV